MSAESVIAVARGELGYAESGNNLTKYWAECYPAFQGQPWCVVFLMWCFRHGGEAAAFFGGAFTGSCGTLMRWYREQGQTVPVEQVQAGDIVILNFHGTQDTEHCGIVEDRSDVGNLSTGAPLYVVTIEGNTGTGSQANGGMVCRKTRYPSQIVAVCRPKYKEEPVLKDDVTGHWAADDIRWCMERRILKGYPDGSFQPDQPVTRAEMAVICKRLYAYTVDADITGLREDIARLKDAR